jgi:hypothetical protein
LIVTAACDGEVTLVVESDVCPLGSTSVNVIGTT